MATAKELRAELKQHVAQMEAMLDDGSHETRNDEYVALERRCEQIVAELEGEESRKSAIEGRKSGLAPFKFAAAGRVTRPWLASDLNGARRGQPTGPAFRTASGETVRAYRGGEPIYSPAGGQFDQTDFGPTPVGDAVAAALTGRPLPMASGNYGASDVAGGFLLAPELSARVVDLARAASVVQRAGALTVPMESEELQIARVTGDPTAYWRGEGVAVTASGMTFDRVTLKAKTCAAIVPVSVEWVEDAANGAQLIESTLATVLGQELDRVALAGTGAASEPRGILNVSGVNTVGSIGAIGDYQDVSEAVEAILTANYTGDISDLAWLLHPREAAAYDQLIGTVDGEPLQPTRWVGQLKQHYTTKLPINGGGGGNEASMIVGDFSQLIIGVRAAARIEILPVGTVTDGDGVTHNAAAELKRLIRAYLRMDVACLRPSHFTVLSGITG